MVSIDLASAEWRTSSRSQANGACVEIAFPDADWRTSTRSQGNCACVQMALTPSVAGIRDSKQPDSGVVLTTFQAWDAFRQAVQRAELDLP
jgi:Domain of unknown function (DUF397)